MALAIEAAKQHCEIKQIDIVGMTLRNVDLKTALIVPETDAGLEIQLRLSRISTSSESTPSYDFSVESCANNTWTVHSEGVIVPVIAAQDFSAPSAHPVNPDVLSQRHTGKRWNDAFRRVGFEYGPSFGLLNKIRTHEKYYQAAGDIPIATTSTAIEDESRHILHPSTVDCLLQLCIISIHAGLYQEMPWGVVPIKLEEVTFLPPAGDDVDTIGQAVAWNNVRSERARYFNTNSQLATKAGKVVLDIKGLHTVAYEATLPPRSESPMKPLPYTGVVWQPDVSIGPLKNALSPSAQAGSGAGAALEVVGMLSHKQPLSSILVVDSSAHLDVDQMLHTVPVTADLRIVDNAALNAEDMDSKEDARITRLAVPEGPVDLASLSLESQDLVVIGNKDAPFLMNSESLSSLKSVLSANGTPLFLLDHDTVSVAREEIQKSGFSCREIALPGQTLAVCSIVPTANGFTKASDFAVLVYSRRHSAPPQALADAMADQGLPVEMKEIEEVNVGTDKQIILYNPYGNLLASLEPNTFETLKDIISSGATTVWLTKGVNEGKCTSGAMVQGFLRVAREEQKMSKLLSLDIDNSESTASIAKTVDAILDLNSHSPSRVENEYWLRRSACNVSRVVPTDDINSRMFADDETTQETSLPRQQMLQANLDGGNVTFSPNDALARLLIKPNQVELQVECLEFYKQDMQTEAEGPRLVSGTVINVGTAADSSLRGSTVLAYVSNPYDTVVRVEAAMCVQCGPSAVKGLVYNLPDLSRAVNAMQCLTGPAEKHHVLLLPTSKSMSQAFTKLSKTKGFKLTVVAEKPVEEPCSNIQSMLDSSDISQIRHLMTGKDGPTAIIAQDFSPFSQEIWRNVPSGGCFILHESKQKSLSAAPEVGPFNRGARFCATTVASSFETDPQSLGNILKTLVSTVKNQVGAFLDAPSVISVNTLKEASQGATDRFVLAYSYEKDMVKV